MYRSNTEKGFFNLTDLDVEWHSYRFFLDCAPMYWRLVRFNLGVDKRASYKRSKFIQSSSSPKKNPTKPLFGLFLEYSVTLEALLAYSSYNIPIEVNPCVLMFRCVFAFVISALTVELMVSPAPLYNAGTSLTPWILLLWSTQTYSFFSKLLFGRISFNLFWISEQFTVGLDKCQCYMGVRSWKTKLGA